MRIIRNTLSVCPKCIKKIKAEILEEHNKVYMFKECEEHGKFKVLLSKDSKYYEELNNLYYSSYIFQEQTPIFFLLITTLNCNLNCPICFVNSPEKNYTISLDHIKDILNQLNKKTIALFGGEPTVREDIFDIIQIITNSKNIPVLFTNGIKLANSEYLEKLKKVGLKKVYFQFDGFDDKVYEILRGRKLLRIKKQVLNNLKKLNINTILEVTIARNINEKELNKIFNFALKNDFINSITFRSYGHLGKLGLEHKENLTTDEIINILEKKTKGKISKKEILNFQNLYFILSDFFPLAKCINKQYLLIYKTKSSYEPITCFLNLSRIKRITKNYKKIKLKNRSIAKLYFLFSFPKLLKLKAFPKLIQFILYMLIEKISKNRFMLNSKKTLNLDFSLMCEPYSFDYEINKNCPVREIKKRDITIQNRGICNIQEERARLNESE